MARTDQKLGILMDPLPQINPKKDSSLAMLREAQQRGYEIYYFTLENLYFLANKVCATTKKIKVFADQDHYFEIIAEHELDLNDLDVLLFRTDPPITEQYLYATYLLEIAEARGLLIINSPAGIRAANEKLFTLWFADCLAPTMVAAQQQQLKNFIKAHGDIVVKPLNAMGGRSIFRIKHGDLNINVILETITNYGKISVMAQKFIPAISKGDKRVLVINGAPVQHGLARIPAADDFRGNLAAGATSQIFKITDQEKKLIAKIAAALKNLKLYFVGVDIIGDYITEINVTSPTCIQEIEQGSQEKITNELFNFIEKS